MTFLARAAGAERRDFVRPDTGALFAAVGEVVDEAEGDTDRLLDLIEDRHGSEMRAYLEWILEAGAGIPDPLAGLTPEQQVAAVREHVAALRILNARRDLAMAGRVAHIGTIGERLAWLRTAERQYPRAALWAQSAFGREGVKEPPARRPVEDLRRRRVERELGGRVGSRGTGTGREQQ